MPGWRAKAVGNGLSALRRLAEAGIVSSGIDSLLELHGHLPNSTEPMELAKVKSAAVIRLDEIGDVVLTSPLLRELRRNLPNADLTLVVRREIVPLVERCPYVNRVIGMPSSGRGGRGELRRMVSAWKLSKERLWDLHLDLALLPRWDMDVAGARLLAKLSGARWRVGFADPPPAPERLPPSPTSSETFLTKIVVGEQGMHEAQRPLELLKSIGGRVEDERLEIWTDDADEMEAEKLLQDARRPLVGMGIAALADIKRWPVERFAAVARHLVEKYGAGIVLIGGPMDRELSKRMRDKLDFPVVDLVGRTTLRQTAAAIRRCAMYVGNDTGPLHMAAALGVPVVVVSCHPIGGDQASQYSAARFGPWRVPSRVVQPIALPPCTSYCQSTGAHCIGNVSVEQVIAAVDELWPKP
jgi:heptosyltransferase-2